MLESQNLNVIEQKNAINLVWNRCREVACSNILLKPGLTSKFSQVTQSCVQLRLKNLYKWQIYKLSGQPVLVKM